MEANIVAALHVSWAFRMALQKVIVECLECRDVGVCGRGGKVLLDGFSDRWRKTIFEVYDWRGFSR